MFDRLFHVIVQKKKAVIYTFYFFWLVIVFVLLITARSVFQDDLSSYVFWYEWAVVSGKSALILFVFVLLPGICNRIRVRHKILAILRIFRRHLGITMFLLATFHGLTVSILPNIKAGPPFVFALFEIFGSVSLFLLFLLFATSNDISEKFLGIWWFRLHRLVYFTMWFILFHVSLQRLSFWTVLAGLLVVAEMSTIIYSHLKK